MHVRCSQRRRRTAMSSGKNATPGRPFGAQGPRSRAAKFAYTESRLSRVLPTTRAKSLPLGFHLRGRP